MQTKTYRLISKPIFNTIRKPNRDDTIVQLSCIRVLKYKKRVVSHYYNCTNSSTIQLIQPLNSLRR